MTIALKRCPFCDARATTGGHSHTGDCFLYLRGKCTTDEEQAAWNRRAPVEIAPAPAIACHECDELRKQLADAREEKAQIASDHHLLSRDNDEKREALLHVQRQRNAEQQARKLAEKELADNRAGSAQDWKAMRDERDRAIAEFQGANAKQKRMHREIVEMVQMLCDAGQNEDVAEPIDRLRRFIASRQVQPPTKREIAREKAGGADAIEAGFAERLGLALDRATRAEERATVLAAELARAQAGKNP